MTKDYMKYLVCHKLDVIKKPFRNDTKKLNPELYNTQS